MKFSIKHFSVNVTESAAYLDTFTEEILVENFIFCKVLKKEVMITTINWSLSLPLADTKPQKKLPFIFFSCINWRNFDSADIKSQAVTKHLCYQSLIHKVVKLLKF